MEVFRWISLAFFLLGTITCSDKGNTDFPFAKHVDKRILSSSSNDSTPIATPAPPKPLPPPLPLTTADGIAFSKKIKNFKKRWWETVNDIKKTAIFDELKTFEKVFFSNTTEVKDWSGTIFSMGTQDGGHDICLMINLNGGNETDEIGITQGCSGSYLSPDPNGIKKGTLVYKQLGEMGDELTTQCVLFSGTIVPEVDDSGGEIGAMRHTFYTMNFTNIERCKVDKKMKIKQ